ncbi:MAG: histidinol-phosphate transaminase [Chloroflexota bacterium]
MRDPGEPTDLLRLRDPVTPYANEASNEEIAASAGIPLEQVIRFDLNTLGGGPLPAVRRALAEFDPQRALEYGDPSYGPLRAAISAEIGVGPERIIPGAGADELIRLVSTMAAGVGDRVVIPTPTFPMYAVEARLAGATTVEVPRAAVPERQPVAALRETAETVGARLVWLCTPNNPTGDRYLTAEIHELAAGLPALVAVDAVYQEFAEASLGLGPEALSLVALQDELPNVLILRSLAKSYGLAGARVGYLVVAAQLAARFDAARLPISVATPSEAAARAALAESAVARDRHRLIIGERDRLAAACRQRGWEVLDTLTNFTLVRPLDADGVAAGLAGIGLVVRSYPTGPLREWLRITARAPEENDRLLAALATLSG